MRLSSLLSSVFQANQHRLLRNKTAISLLLVLLVGATALLWGMTGRMKAAGKTSVASPVVASVAPLAGELELWELSTLTGATAGPVTATAIDPNVMAGELRRGAGLTAVSNTGAFNSSGWFTTNGISTTLANAIANNDYYEFTLPINAGYAANITSISLAVRSSSTGPNTGTLRSSIDNYTADLGTVTITTTDTIKSIPVSLNNATGTVTFRFYGYGSAAGSGSTPATGGTMRIGPVTGNDLSIFGTTRALPGVSIGDVTLPEGNSGATTFNFMVSLSEPAFAPVTMNFATADESALAGSDYTAASGTLNFAVGEQTKTVMVTVSGDTATEPDETFFVNLSNVVGATSTDGRGLGTIRNDDMSALPALSISDATVTEGNSGTITASFTVSLSSPAPAGGITFDIATADDSATSGSGDYVVNSLTGQTISAGLSTYTFNVTVNGDTGVEPHETFFVNVTNVTGATVADGQGLGTINNDDTAARLTISDASIVEGNSGTTNLVFTVMADRPIPAASGYEGAFFTATTADITATGGTDYVALTNQSLPVISSGNTSITFNVEINGDTVPEPDETFRVTLTKRSSDLNYEFADNEAIGTIRNDDLTKIHEIQGSSETPNFVGQTRTIEGIVVGDFQGAASVGLQGFFVQEEDADADADPLTSEGMYVFEGATTTAVSVGDKVRVSGTVTNFGGPPGVTEMTSPAITIISSGNALPAVTTVTLPETVNNDLERYENMLVRFSQTLTVTGNENYFRFGELVLSSDGRIFQQNNFDRPNSVAALAAASLIPRRYVILDDGRSGSYLDPVAYHDGAPTRRLGDTVTGLTGVLTFNFSEYRVHPTSAPSFVIANPRPATPPAVGGNIKVASFNVLNYFNGNGAGGGFPTSRGADSLVEFNRQRAKIIAAILALNADVVGLIEIENDGNGATSAIQDLVNGLNASVGAGTYAWREGVTPGTDVIKNSIIYKPAIVTPIGDAVNDTAAIWTGQARNPLAQTFSVNSNGQKFIYIVSHFTSKSCGSSDTGLDADQGDGQGCDNLQRTLQADALLDFIRARQIAASELRVIAMGDLNAYGEEDPIVRLEEDASDKLADGTGGLIDQLQRWQATTTRYSYQFNSQSGYLDHALATKALNPFVTGAAEWHINADEPVYLDYNVENKNTAQLTYNTDTVYRSSDHDPVLVGLLLNAPPTLTAGATATRQQGVTATSATIATVSDDLTAAGSVTVAATTVPAGITMTNITNINGTITATVAASCTATLGDNIVVLTATDGNGASSTANFIVNVTPNTPPVLTYAAGPMLVFGGGTAINPASGPTDNVSVSSVALQSQGSYTGGLAVAANGVITLTNAAPVGAHTLIIRATDGCGASTDAPVTITVNRASTTTTITADTPDPTVFGQNYTVSFTVAAVAPGAGTPTGNVMVSDGTNRCTATVAAGSCVLPSTSIGAKTLTATYVGDANFNGSSAAAVLHTVNKANTTTTITSDNPDPSAAGQSVTVTYVVTPVAPGGGTPTGAEPLATLSKRAAPTQFAAVSQLNNVTVTASTGESCTGTVAAGSCTITFTTLGTRNLTAIYAGDANFNGSTSAPEPHNVIAQPITVIAPSVTLTTVGQLFSGMFTQTGGIGATTFSTVSALPAGVTLNPNGTLSGTPTQAGTFVIVVKATDSNGAMGQISYTLQVSRFTGSFSDPVVCLGPGGLSAGTVQIVNPAPFAQAFTLNTTFTNYVGVPGSCVLTGAAAGATCTVTATGLTASGTINANTTLTVQYQGQVADVPNGTTITASNVATLNGGTLAPNPLIFTTNITCPPVGVGAPYPAASAVSDQKAGSILFYNLFTSEPTNSAAQNTRLTITNTHPTLTAYVHLFFVDGASCSVADSYLCLTGNQTAALLASDVDPGTTGYVVAVATDRNGCPTNFNYLIGDEYVKLVSGHAANLGAEAIAAVAGGLPACNATTSTTATLAFDGVSYNLVPRVIAANNVPSRADGNDSLLVVNRIGGDLATGAATLGTLFGILYDDAESPYSLSISAGTCQARIALNNSLRVTPRMETLIPAGRSGWLKVSGGADIGLLGALLTRNAQAATGAGAFNQGHNLHKLSLTRASLTIPIFPPAC